MSFLYPEVFLYLLPPLFILFGLLLTQQESQAQFFSDEVMSKLRVSANSLTLRARNALFFLMAFFMVVAIAGPVIKDGEIDIKAKSSDIMIALDISDSMLATDVYPSRLDLAKKKAKEFLKLDANERVGVVAFAKNSYLVSPFSFDHDAVEFLLSHLDTNSMTEKGTDFLSLLGVVAKSSKNDKKYLFILSDGGDEKDFSKEIEFAKENNIVVFILGFGTKNGAPIKLKNGEFIKQNGKIIVSKLNENIADFATKTGGVYIKAIKSDEDIKTMLSEIKSIGDAKELKSQKIPKYTPLFYYPLGLALILLLVATSSISKREKTSLFSLLVVFLISFPLTDAKAGLFDFEKLQKAKNSYEKGEYKEASKIYEDYASEHNNGESYFNAGNAFYKLGDYKKAIESYQRATFDDASMRAKNYANMGNAHVKGGKKEDLLEAIKKYEESLKITEDKEVRENLENVKKALKEQEKQKQKDKNNNQDNQDKQNKDQDQQNKKNKQNQDKESDKSKNEEKNQEKKDSEKKEQKKSQQDSSEDKKKQQKPEQASQQKAQMSDAEQQKWLDKLNQHQNTYMYRLNQNKAQKESTDEKPW
jgi:Ca-activated chloride channel family protein